MPINQNDEPADPISPKILLLWERRAGILIPAVLAALITYGLTFLIKEEFVANAQIYVNKANYTDLNTDIENTQSPATVARLLQNSDLLQRVRNDYLAQFGGRIKDMPLEKFSKQFKVKTEILQDTSLKKELSPIIDLSIQSEGTSQTKYLMDTWLREFIQTFGSYASQEYAEKRDALTTQLAAVGADLKKMEAERAVLQAGLPLEEKLLQQYLDALAPAQPPSRASASGSTPGGLVTGVVTGSNTQVNVNLERGKPGLIDRLTELQLQQRMAESGTTTRPLGDISVELKAVQSEAGDLQSSVAVLQKSIAEKTARLDTVERTIRMQSDFETRLRKNLDRFRIAASNVEAGTDNRGNAGADIRILATAALPEEKVWPRRTLLSLAVALTVIIFSSVGILALSAFRETVRRLKPLPPEQRQA